MCECVCMLNCSPDLTLSFYLSQTSLDHRKSVSRSLGRASTIEVKNKRFLWRPKKNIEATVFMCLRMSSISEVRMKEKWDHWVRCTLKKKYLGDKSKVGCSSPVFISVGYLVGTQDPFDWCHISVDNSISLATQRYFIHVHHWDLQWQFITILANNLKISLYVILLWLSYPTLDSVVLLRLSCPRLSLGCPVVLASVVLASVVPASVVLASVVRSPSKTAYFWFLVTLFCHFHVLKKGFLPKQPCRPVPSHD